jgi:hypothetical protein
MCSGSPLSLSKQDETPAEQRARAALEKAQAREIVKQGEAKVKLGELILAKTGPVLVSLSSLLNKPEMAIVADIIRAPLQESLDLFTVYEDSARSIIAAYGVGELAMTDMKDPCCPSCPPSCYHHHYVAGSALIRCSGFRSCPMHAAIVALWLSVSRSSLRDEKTLLILLFVRHSGLPLFIVVLCGGW